MKKLDCSMCGNSTFHCPSGEHVKEPGKIHTGFGATNDSVWDCPNCRGRGFILLSVLDRFCQYIYKRGRRAHSKVHPRTH